MIFANPVPGTIYGSESGTRLYRSQGFGCTGYPAEQRLNDCAHFHRAIDVAPSDGRGGVDLLAAAAGKVICNGRLNDGALVLGIYHGSGWVTGYAHNASNLVAVGTEVKKGQHVAEMGQSGNATGNHVHFIVKADFMPSGNPIHDLNNLILDDPKYPVSGISSTRGLGTWADPWTRLEQNVRVRPTGPGQNIRVSPGGAVYAHTQPDGHIHRISDDADLGATSAWRDWGGNDPSTALGQAFWRRIQLGSDYFYLGNTVSEQSAS